MYFFISVVNSHFTHPTCQNSNDFGDYGKIEAGTDRVANAASVG
jgi:hypothetical protein